MSNNHKDLTVARIFSASRIFSSPQTSSSSCRAWPCRGSRAPPRPACHIREESWITVCSLRGDSDSALWLCPSAWENCVSTCSDSWKPSLSLNLWLCSGSELDWGLAGRHLLPLTRGRHHPYLCSAADTPCLMLETFHEPCKGRDVQNCLAHLPYGRQ